MFALSASTALFLKNQNYNGRKDWKEVEISKIITKPEKKKIIIPF